MSKKIGALGLSAAIAGCTAGGVKPDGNDVIHEEIITPDTSTEELNNLKEEVVTGVARATKEDNSLEDKPGERYKSVKIPDLGSPKDIGKTSFRVYENNVSAGVEKGQHSLEASVSEFQGSTILDMEYKKIGENVSILMKARSGGKTKIFAVSAKLYNDKMGLQVTAGNAWHDLEMLSESYKGKTVEEFLVGLDAELKVGKSAYLGAYANYSKTSNTILSIEEVTEIGRYEKVTTETTTLFDGYRHYSGGLNAKVVINDNNLITGSVGLYEEGPKSGTEGTISWENRGDNGTTRFNVTTDDRGNKVYGAEYTFYVGENTELGAGVVHSENNNGENTSGSITITYLFDGTSKPTSFNVPGAITNRISVDDKINMLIRGPKGSFKKTTQTNREKISEDIKPTIVYNGVEYSGDSTAYMSIVRGGEYAPVIDYTDNRDDKDRLKIEQVGKVDTDKVGKQMVQYKVTDVAGNITILTVYVTIIEQNTEVVADVIHGEKTQNSISLLINADDTDGITGYEVYRDGKLITSGENSSTKLALYYTDKDLEPGEEYDYEVVIYSKNPETGELEEKRLSKSFTTLEKVLSKPVVESISGDTNLKESQELKLQINMEDSAQKYTYKVLGRYASQIDVDDSGEVSGYLSIGLHYIQIEIKNKNGDTALAESTINVESNYVAPPIDYTPTDLDISSNTIRENLPSGTIVGTLSCAGAAGNSCSYTVSGGPFAVDASGNLFTTAILNYEPTPSYSLLVTAISTVGGNPCTKNITINVGDQLVPTAPAVTVTPSGSEVELSANSVGADSYNYYIDGSLVYSGASSSHTESGLSVGSHTYRVEAVNAEGVSMSTGATFDIVSLAPTITSITPSVSGTTEVLGYNGGNRYGITGGTYDFTFVPAVSGGMGVVVGMEINGVYHPGNPVTKSLDIFFGINTFSFRVKNASGVWSAVYTLDIEGG